MIRSLAFRLLGRHIGGRPQRHAQPRQLVGLRFSSILLSPLRQQLRKPEVEHFRLAARSYDDVARLYVAVDYALCVRRCKGISHLQGDRKYAVETEWLAADCFLESFAGHILHRYEVLIIDFSDFEYRADVRMIQS